MAAITSKDPRKAGIVSALKALSRGSKVTMVKEVAPGVFQGHCMAKDPNNMTRRVVMASLGYFKVQAVKNEAGIVTHYTAVV